MRSLWLENHTLSLRGVPSPEKSGEALIRIRPAASRFTTATIKDYAILVLT